MALHYSLLDVFSEQPFQGTQIPVVTVDTALPDHARTQIAGEFHQTETVFIDPRHPENPVAVFNSQGPACFGAHTLLAAAHAAHSLNISVSHGNYAQFDIKQGDETIHCFIDTPNNAETGQIQFSRTLMPSIDRFTPPVERIAEALNLDKKHLSFSRYRPMAVRVDNPTLIVPVTRPEHILAARLNSDRWSELLAETYVNDIFLFAPKSTSRDTQFHGRLLNPTIAHGVFPPIGNVIPEFIAFLVEQTETAPGTHTFSIDRGSDSTRRSVLHVEFDKRPGKPTQCRIGGNVIRMGAGELFFPAAA